MHIEQGLYDKAIRELQAIAALPTSTPEDIAYLGYRICSGGQGEGSAKDPREARALEPSSATFRRSSSRLIHAGLGEMDEAFTWIGEGVRRTRFLSRRTAPRDRATPLRAPIHAPSTSFGAWGSALRRARAGPRHVLRKEQTYETDRWCIVDSVGLPRCVERVRRPHLRRHQAGREARAGRLMVTIALAPPASAPGARAAKRRAGPWPTPRSPTSSVRTS